MNKIPWLWVLVAVLVGAVIGWVVLQPGPPSIPGQDAAQMSGEAASPTEETVAPATVMEEGRVGGPSEEPAASDLTQETLPPREEPRLETPVVEKTTVVVEKATIRQLLDNRDRYHGATVLVEGKVATQCVVRGCWFILEDQTGVILVELVEEALDNPIPRGSIGRAVQVRGKFFFAPRPRIVLERPEDWSFR